MPGAALLKSHKIQKVMAFFGHSFHNIVPIWTEEAACVWRYETGHGHLSPRFTDKRRDLSVFPVRIQPDACYVSDHDSACLGFQK